VAEEAGKGSAGSVGGGAAAVTTIAHAITVDNGNSSP
jgi:hypothetical protein